jgi:exonuclease VII small subunit
MTKEGSNMARADDFKVQLQQAKQQLKQIREEKMDCLQMHAFAQAVKLREQEAWVNTRILNLQTKIAEAGYKKSPIPAEQRISKLELLVEELQNHIEQLERRIAFGK